MELCEVSASMANRSLWRAALLHALPNTALVLGLFYHWFAVADRYIVFLYYHDMGPFVPDTSPFSAVTSSRYWMAGLVASGAVMVLHTTLGWLLARLVGKSYRSPVWWRVWIMCLVPLLIGIPAITMTANGPTLPLLNAVQATIVTLLGLGLALLPSSMVAGNPGGLVWLAAEGWGVMLMLVAIASLDELPQWREIGRAHWLLIALGLLAAGVLWLLLVTGARVWRGMPVWGVAKRSVAGVTVAYVLMPLVHHVIGTDGYYYISNSGNFFARAAALQAVAWAVALGIIAGVTHVHRVLGPQRARALSRLDELSPG
jgi:hypothetical protein